MCEYSHILIRKMSKITNMVPLFFVASVTEKTVVSCRAKWKGTQKNLVRSFLIKLHL